MTTRSRQRDRGFTLVEVMIVLVLTAVVGGVVAAALITSLSATSSTTEQIADSTDAGVISSFLVRDAQSAGATLPTTGARDTTVGVSTETSSAGWSGCEQESSALVVRFSWIDRSTTAAQRTVTTYALRNGQLTRRLCTDGTAVDAVLGQQLTSAVATCQPTTDCTGVPTQVSVALRGFGARAPLQYTLSASMRADTQTPPSWSNSLQVPLLTLGPVSSCPSLELAGTGSVTVLGSALVDGTCGAQPVRDDRALLHANAGTHVSTTLVDPFGARPAPATNACTAGGANPATIGASPNRDATIVYPQPVKILTSTNFLPGRYVFCGGLELTSGRITGTDVVLYVAGATLEIRPEANVDLTGRLSGSDASLLLWLATPQQTLKIAGGTTVANLRGLVYAPASRLELSSVVGVNVGGLVAKDVKITGDGAARIGLPIPTIAISPAVLPSGHFGVQYATNVSASGGTAPYTWSASGLPAGLSIDPSSGVISGIPISAGLTNGIVVSAVDSTSASASIVYALAVEGGLGIFTGHQDVGQTGRPGSSWFEDPVYTVNTGKGDIGGGSDAYQYIYRSMTGDGRLTARVVSQSTQDKGQAGVMFRETLDATSPFVMAGLLESNGGEVAHRDTAGGPTTSVPNDSAPPPYWVRLIRSGNVFTAERSADGVIWVDRQDVTIPMGSTIYVGLAVSGHDNDNNLSTATFDNVAIATPPTVTTTAGPLAYAENATTAVDPTMIVADPDSAQLVGATVTLSVNYTNGEDSLGFTAQNGISGTWSAATGTMTLSGDAGVAEYQAALRSVTYRNTSDDPTTATRSVTIVVDDGLYRSTAAGRAITITAVDDAPRVSTTGAALVYIEDSAPIVDPGITVADVDDATLASANVSISSGYVAGQDVLAFTNMNGITGSWAPSSGVLTLTGVAPVGDYQAALASVTYRNTSHAPSTAPRTITFTVNDGTLDSDAAAKSLTVAAVNDAPVNSVPATQTTPKNTAEIFSTANGNAMSISDVDAGSAALQVQLTATNGTITVSGTAGLTFTAGDGTADATMTFTGTVANVNAALSGMRLTPTTNFVGAASVRIVTSDQGNTGSGGALTDTDTVAVIVDSAPVVTTTATSLAYTENGTTAVDAGLTISDADSTNLTSAVVRIAGGYVNGEDTLAFTTQNGITGTWNAPTGVLTLSGSTTVTNYRTALRSITYRNATDAPSTTNRTVTFTVNDGFLDSNAASRTITISAVNDAPVNGVPATQTTPRNSAEVFSSANGSLISVSDVDLGAGTLQVQLVGTNGTVTLSGVSGLSFTVGDGIADATMTFSGTAANVNAALAGLRFNPAANFTGTASLKIVSSDLGSTGSGGAKTDTDTVNITVT